MTGSRVIRGWSVAGAALLFGAALALVALLLVLSPVRAQGVIECESKNKPQVPGAVEQDEYCLADLSTKGLIDQVHTTREDWQTLHAAESTNPSEVVPGLQIDGYFPDGSDDSNCNNSAEFGGCHDAQFVIRLPEEWNGKLVITGAPGVRRQYANDYIISDWVLARGYAFASTDKGNTGTSFYEDGERPGDAVAEWHRRVEQLTLAAKDTTELWYGQRPEYTYMTGISNGGYLTRYAIEHNPELYDGAVDWEGTLFRRNGPNLFTHLPQALRNHEECLGDPGFDNRACDNMYRAGYKRGSEFLWEQHYGQYWDLTQRTYREEFDPGYDDEQKAGTPLCQEDGDPKTRCDAEYRYFKRPEKVKDRVERVSLTGKIGKPMITLHGTLDTLLPIRRYANVYREMIENQGKARMHRYYVIEDGNHVDSFYDVYPRTGPTALRPILPCYRAAFVELEEWVEQPNSPDGSPPPSKFVPNPQNGNEANNCSINQEATYSSPAPPGP